MTKFTFNERTGEPAVRYLTREESTQPLSGSVACYTICKAARCLVPGSLSLIGFPVAGIFQRCREMLIAIARFHKADWNSVRLVAGQCDAMHDAFEPAIVIHRVVLGAAIIPEGEGTALPAKAAGELRSDLVLEEIV